MNERTDETPKALQFTVGRDAEGDACIYAQRLQSNGDAGDYLTVSQLREVLSDLLQTAEETPIRPDRRVTCHYFLEGTAYCIDRER